MNVFVRTAKAQARRMDQRDAPEVQMTDAATFVPYTRFLEVRARRLQIAAELSQVDSVRKSDARVASAPVVDEERGTAVRIATFPPSGVAEA